MKTGWLILIGLAVVVVAVAWGAGDSTQNAQPARYVLITGTSRLVAEHGGVVDMPIVMRMDTTTGRAWICGTPARNAGFAWVPVGEPANDRR